MRMFRGQASQQLEEGAATARGAEGALARHRPGSRSLRREIALGALMATLALGALVSFSASAQAAPCVLPLGGRWTGTWETNRKAGGGEHGSGKWEAKTVTVTGEQHFEGNASFEGTWENFPITVQESGIIKGFDYCLNSTTAITVTEFIDEGGLLATYEGEIKAGNSSAVVGSWKTAENRYGPYGPEEGTYTGSYIPSAPSKGTVSGQVELVPGKGTLPAYFNTEPAPAGLPSGATAVVGAASFAIVGLTPGGSTNVKLILPKTSGPTEFYKFVGGAYQNVTLAEENNEFLITTTGNGEVNLHLTDGGILDEDGKVNGEVVDPLVPVRNPKPPTAVTEPASSLTPTSATLNAKVNPKGTGVTKCVLEYGTSTAYGLSQECSPSPRASTTPVPVTAEVTELAANTHYHFRISATTARGTAKGADQTFTTPSNPPTVTTEPATSVTQTAATLNGTVNPEGVTLSDCHFEYGTTEAYGTSVPCSSLPGGESPVAVSAVASSLQPNTTYHFRISATNVNGTSTGSDQTFTTPPNPPAVVTEAASSVTQTTASLNGTVNPEGANVSDCHFEYGTSEAYGTSVPCSALPGSGTSPVAVSAAISSLSANTTYHFRIVATNVSGTSYGSDATFTTPANPPSVVSEPASSITQTSATLNGTVNPEGANVSNCHFEYGTTVSYGVSVPCATLPGSGTSPVAVSAALPPGTLSENTAYHYRIVATNSSGTSYGSDETFTTLANPPTVITGAATSITQTSATLNATVDPEGANVSDCHFEYGTTEAYGTSAPCSALPGSGESPVAVSTPIGSLTASTTYHYRISATNSSGTSDGADHTFMTLANVGTPHWYHNTAKVPQSERVPTISWGTLTLTSGAPSTAGPTSCEGTAGGYVENPVGGAAGTGQTQSFSTYNCTNAGCPAGLVEFPASSGKFVEKQLAVMPGPELPGIDSPGTASYARGSLPWSNVLSEAEAGKIRTESKGVVLVIACVAAKTAGPNEHEQQLLGAPTVCSTTATNLQNPLDERGTNFGPNQSKIVFDKGSGSLLCKGPGAKEGEEVVFEGTTSGSLKLMGYKGSELISAKTP
jgi:phosphodiesterase/alkaline phosphatase D-like protein